MRQGYVFNGSSEPHGHVFKVQVFQTPAKRIVLRLRFYEH